MSKRILVVEGDDSNIQQIYDLLGESFEIVHAPSCDAAIKHLLKEYSSIDLILANAEAMRRDKYRLVSLMERNTTVGPVPLIYIGDHYYDEAARHTAEADALKSGALDFISPPYDAEIIINRIYNITKLRGDARSKYYTRTENALKRYETAISKGTFWNPDSVETLIMRTYVGAACVLEWMDDRISVLQANDRFAQEILGRKEEYKFDFIEDIRDSIEGKSFERLTRAMQKAANSDEDVSCELLLRNLNNDDSLQHICADIKLITQIKNRRLFYCTVKNDTGQYETQLREREIAQQLQSIIQNAYGGVSAVTTDNGKIRYLFANNQYYALFGYTKEQFEAELENGLHDLILPEYHALIDDTLENNATAEQAALIEYKARRRDGSVIWVRSRSSICSMNMVSERVYVSVLVDCTAEKRAVKRMETLGKRLGNSDIYLRLNVTDRKIEEYNSIFETPETIEEAKQDGELYETKLLAALYSQNYENDMNTWSYSGLARHFENGDTRLTAEYRRCLPGGEIRWFRATIILMEGVTSATVNAFIYAHNIDIEKKNEMAQRAIVDKNIDAITIINIASGMARTVKIFDERISAVDEVYDFNITTREFMLAAAAEEDKLRCERFFTLENIVSCLNKRGYADISFWIVAADGTSRRMNTQLTYLDDTRECILMVGRDITELFEKEQEHQAALQKAAIEADAANKAKSDFLARMSHDFRAPLAAILGLTELAEGENTSPETKDYLRKITFSSQYLLNLVNDTLDLSRIESGRIALNRAPYAIDEFIEAVNTVMRPLFDVKNITLELSLKREVTNIIVDKLRFTQVFFNLLSNAAKYTPMGGHVKFWSESIPGKDGKCGMRFHLSDNGIGISKEFQAFLFDPFTQENRPELSERKGSGLGLAIVKRILDETGGSIRVISEVGKGTEFIVDLYAYNEEKTTIEKVKPKYDPEILKGKRVLLVEDTEINSMIMVKLLGCKGCIVDTAENGQEGLDAFAASKPGYYDIILTDIRMPVMDGLEETRRIRAMDRPDAKTIPIIGATADAYPEAEDRTKVAGMNERIVKPVNTELLIETVARLISKG